MLRKNQAVNLRTFKNTMTEDKNSKNFSYLLQLGIFIGLTGAGMVVYSMISTIIWKSMTGLPVSSMLTEMANPKFSSAIITLQVVATFCMMFLPALFFAKACNHDAGWYLGTRTATSWRQYVLVAGMLIFVFPLGGALAQANEMIPLPANWTLAFKEIEEKREAMEQALIHINTFPQYLLSLVIMAFLPAVFEEFFFRGGLQNLLTRWFNNPLAAILLTAVIFSLIHQSYYGFLVRAALGVILGYIFYLSGSIKLPILLHFLFNGIQVTALYFSNLTGKPDTPEMSDNFILLSGIPALIIIIILFKVFDKECIRLINKFTYQEPDPNDISDWIAKK